MKSETQPASAALRTHFTREGVAVVTRARIAGLTRSGEAIQITYTVEGETRETLADALMIATGRAATIEGLDLEAAGVRYDTQQGILVDANLRTSNPRIYSAGDVTGGFRFTHAAAAQARTAVRNALFPGGSAFDARVMPWARSLLLCLSTLPTSPAEPHVLAHRDLAEPAFPRIRRVLASETKFRAPGGIHDR